MNTRSGSKGFLPVLAHLVFTAACYVFYLLPIVGARTVFVAGDNINYNFRNYVYFANSLIHGFGFPSWYQFYGGVPVGHSPQALSLSPFVPHRFIGYILYAILPLDSIMLYKITLTVGMLLIGLGWWLVIYKVSKSRAGATFGTLMVLLGGTGMSIFHEEQILMTVSWVPWFVLATLKIKEEFNYILVAAVLLGASLTVHYPQILLISATMFILALVLTGNIDLAFLRAALKRKYTLALAFVLFCLSASPVLYIFIKMGDFASPVRGTSDIAIKGLAEYIRINTMQYSSLPLSLLKNYIIDMYDSFPSHYSVYATGPGILLALYALVARRRAALAPLIVLLLTLWATVGINGYLPHILFLLKVPSISYFRQWFHFFPMVNFSLALLGGLGFAALSERLGSWFAKGKQDRARRIVWPMLVVLVAVMLFQSSLRLRYYVDTFLAKDRYIGRFDKEGFVRLINRGNFKYFVLVTYKEWTEVIKTCPEAVRLDAFFVGPVDNAGETMSRGLEKQLESICVPGFSATQKAYISRATALQYTPDGATMRGYLERPSMLVLPMNIKLRPVVRINNTPVKAFPVYGGAMFGFMVPAGRFHVEVAVASDRYRPFVPYQYILLAGTLGFVVFTGRRKERTSDGLRGDG